MAYDHNLRQRKNAQKAAEEVFEPKSHRDERILSSHASRNTWLAIIGLVVVMALAYWIVDHFGTKGVKSSAKTVPDQLDEVNQPIEQQVAPVESKEASQLQEKNQDQDLQRDQADIEAENLAGQQVTPLTQTEASISQAGDTVPRQASTASTELIQDKGLPALPDSPESVTKDAQRLRLESLPMPEETNSQADMTFYDEMQTLDVPLDDAEKYPILLKTPEYIVAGSFYQKEAAYREQRRLKQHGEVLQVVSTTTRNNKTVYILKTQLYDNRRVLGARKNALRDLGVQVMSYPVRD